MFVTVNGENTTGDFNSISFRFDLITKIFMHKYNDIKFFIHIHSLGEGGNQNIIEKQELYYQNVDSAKEAYKTLISDIEKLYDKNMIKGG